MPTSLSQLPRDTNGIVVEVRFRHRLPNFSGMMGGTRFFNGEAGPVCGREAERIVAAIGSDLEFERWDGKQVEVDPRVERAPSRSSLSTVSAPSAAPVASPKTDLPDDREALRSIAEARGVDISRSWGVGRLKRAIRKHEEQTC